MAGTQEKRGLGKIADLLEELKQRKPPVVSRQATVSEIVDAFVQSHHSHILYVVDSEGKLRGVISLGNLVRHVFFLYHDPSIDARSLVSMAISETAGDFMQREPMFTVVSEDVEDVLQRMINNNVKEIPILDDEKRIVADLTIVDLLKHYKWIKGPDLS
ncbi:MAG: CBS domain-containing protein [Desulfobacterales bacterium]|nr:CBS domain-containing protein [Desulfobacterales bacterium]